MRYRGMLLVAAAIGTGGSAGARPPIATPADSTAFSADCDSKQPRATCVCVLNALQRSLEGQIVLDSYALSVRYGNAAVPNAAMIALLNRYNMKMSEFKAIADGAETFARATVAGCR